MQPIIENVWFLPGMIVGRVYVIKDADGLTLIDTAVAPSGPRAIKHLEANGYKPSDVKRILITHAHPDHIGGLHSIQQTTGAEVMASAQEAQVIQGEIPVVRVKRSDLSGLMKLLQPPNYWSKPPVKVSRILKDGDILPEVLGGLHVISTPGHSPDHIAFWQPEKRILFCGDVLFNLRGITLPIPFLTVDMAEDKRSVRKLVELNVDTICFGHGDPISVNTASQLKQFAQKVGAM